MTDLRGTWNNLPAVESQVETMLGQMTLEQKISLVSGQDDVVGKPDLRPPLAFAPADGPVGVRLAGRTPEDRQVTALPAPIALAATWDPDLARQYGDVLGTEMAATGHNVMLEPAVDIARCPRGGRTFGSFGEDPLLQARLVAPEAQAIQAHGVQTCIKHYLANNQEAQRTVIDVRVDERILQEIYLLPFRAALQDRPVS